jgi:hypothetical protein
LKTEVITPAQIVQELQRLMAEMDKGVNALFDAERNLAQKEADYDREVSKAFLANQGTVADRQAVAKLQSVDAKFEADLAKAEYNRIKLKMKNLSDQATMTAVMAKQVEITWKHA